MMLITCPNCGPRDEIELRWGGQADLPYPERPDELTDAEWSRFLFYRDNPRGLLRERWLCATGCRRWFTVVRDTVTNEIVHVGSFRVAPAGDG